MPLFYSLVKLQTMATMSEAIKIHYKLYNCNENLQESIPWYVEENITGKMDSYFAKVLGKKKDAEITIAIKLEKNKKWLFNGKFSFMLDGVPHFYHTRGWKPFKHVRDLINHAFDHLKLQLSSPKK